MKAKLFICCLLIALVSCKTSNIAKAVSTQTLADINGKTIKVVEKMYTIRDTEKILKYERHIRFNSNGQIHTFVEYDASKNIETGKIELEKIAELEYVYKGKKIVKIIENFYNTSTSTTTDYNEKATIDKKDSSIIYSYVNNNTVRYGAFKKNTLDHTGTITINENFEVTEIIEYPNGKSKPVTYNKKFDNAFKLLEKERVYYYNDVLKKEKSIYQYKDGFMISTTTPYYKATHEYKFDSHGNWIQKSTKISDDLIEVVTRDIVYK